MNSRRSILHAVPLRETANASLWLDKYLTTADKDDTKAKWALVDETASFATVDIYVMFYQRWLASLAQRNAQTREAEVCGRMSVGLGAESVLETSIALQRTYGVPYIPGSALKGLAASYVRNRLDQQTWGVASKAYCTLFGDTYNAGYVTFHDALYIPSSAKNNKPLSADVITVHHPEYYQGVSGAAPADWDSPIPIPFLSATGKYLVALSGPDAWVGTAFGILEWALAQMGIGAKTSSGYGRMKLLPPPLPPPSPDAEDARIVAAFLQRLTNLPDPQVAGQVAQYVDEWRKLAVNAKQKRRAAQGILDKVRSAGREKASKEKAWYQELLAITED